MSEENKRYIGDGYGFSDGFGDGTGGGDGGGYGGGYGDGCGTGNGNGNGNGYGFGDGFGDGFGNGFGYGNGFGNGNGDGTATATGDFDGNKQTNKGKKMDTEKHAEKYVIVRTYSAGVFAGYLQSRIGQEVTLTNARRLWYWSGASSLSQLAMEGVKRPDDCKFPVAVDRVELLQAIEILDTTEDARLSIAAVPVWKQ